MESAVHTPTGVSAGHPTNAELRRLIFASSLGSVIEWYDFMVYVSLAVYIGPMFFVTKDETVRVMLSVATLSTGYVVRPLGGMLFGVVGDRYGRKITFIWTLLVMGLATAGIGLLPTYDQVGLAAPVLLLICRMLQGMALGGEYAGAAVYVAEHAPSGKRGLFTGWIQASTSAGQLSAIAVIFILQYSLTSDDFAAWGWRIPFLLSAIILGVSLYVRSQLAESPAFVAMKSAHTESRKPFRDTWRWSNLKLMLIALFGAVAGHATLGNMGLVFSLLYLQSGLHVSPHVTSAVYAGGLILSLPFFVFFGWLSDRIGRKRVMVFGMLLAAVSYLPIYRLMTIYSNPVDPLALSLLVFAHMFLISLVFGPLAAYLVELFPTRVRTTSLSIPYNIGTGIIGGLLPLIVFSIRNATGSIYVALAYPISVATIAALVNIFFVRDRHGQSLE